MKIGEIAKQTGLKIETVRFYETEGLIAPPERSGGNYRLYNSTHLNRLSFIKRARDLGFTLDQVRDLLRLADDPRGSCDEVDAIAELHDQEIDRKLADLTVLRSELIRWGSQCNATTIADCRMIDALTSSKQSAHG